MLHCVYPSAMPFEHRLKHDSNCMQYIPLVLLQCRHVWRYQHRWYVVQGFQSFDSILDMYCGTWLPTSHHTAGKHWYNLVQRKLNDATSDTFHSGRFHCYVGTMNISRINIGDFPNVFYCTATFLAALECFFDILAINFWSSKFDVGGVVHCVMPQFDFSLTLNGCWKPECISMYAIVAEFPCLYTSALVWCRDIPIARPNLLSFSPFAEFNFSSKNCWPGVGPDTFCNMVFSQYQDIGFVILDMTAKHHHLFWFDVDRHIPWDMSESELVRVCTTSSNPVNIYISSASRK